MVSSIFSPTLLIDSSLSSSSFSPFLVYAYLDFGSFLLAGESEEAGAAGAYFLILLSIY